MRVSIFYLVFIICSLQLLLASSGNGQSIDDIKVTVGLRKGEGLESLFKKIERQSDLLFAYDYEKVNAYNNITLAKASRTIRETLDIVLQGTPFVYRQVNSNVVIYQEGEEPDWEAETLLLHEGKAVESSWRISGSVIDIQGTPIAGVNVIVKGTTRGTSTDAEGKFSIDAEGDDILAFSFIGFKTFETQVSARLMINVTLEEEVEALKEVVVNAGYYNVKEREKTGSISTLDAKIIARQPVTDPIAALQGRMPGVYIEQSSGTPGSSFKIQIRGRNSLRIEANDPLYIVNGVPFSSEKTFSGYVQGNFGSNGINNVSNVSPLASINPADIESIEVLKDADATAIYGSRGANGVVLITTKKGKPGKTTFDLNVYTGAGKATNVKLLNTKQYISLRKQAFAGEGLIPSADPLDPAYAPDLAIWDTTRYTNWLKVLMGEWANTTSVQSSISGGTDQTHLLFSLGYRSEDPVYKGSGVGYHQGSFNLGANHQSEDKKLSIDVSINGARDGNNQLGESNYSQFRAIMPNAPSLYDENGNLNWENSTWLNPMAWTQITYRNDVINLIGNSAVTYEIVPGLRLKTNLGVNYFHSKERRKIPHTSRDPNLGDVSSDDSFVTEASGNNQAWSIEPQLNWEKKVFDGKLTVFAGATFQGQQLERKADSYAGFPTNAMMDNLAAAARSSNHESMESLYRYTAISGRLNYNWQGRYILNMTARRDGSSRFGPGKQFGNFGAAGVAWIFSNEKLLRGITAVMSFGKLRASYGITGSDNIGNYKYLDTYTTGSSSGNGQYQGVTWLGPSKLFNPDYAWEVNKKFEVALETAWVDDRIAWTVAYFRNRSSNQLIDHPLPKTTGFSGVLANLPATVQNKGIEFELRTINVESGRPIQWTTSFNITFPRNKLVAFPGLEASVYADQYVIGEPLAIRKLFEYTGVDPETGLYTVTDANGDGVISEPEDDSRIVFLGPRFFGGLNNSVNYKNWSLDFLFQFVSQSGTRMFYQPGKPGNIPVFVLEKKIWRHPGDLADFQRLFVNDPVARQAQINYNQSDAMVSNASYIRFKTVSLAYQLPKKWTRSLNCRLYFQGQNLFVVTVFEGYDTESRDLGGLAPLRMFTVGAQLTF